jgi:hypothetical protein
MGQRTLVPDAGEVVLHELRAVGRTGLVMILRSAGEEGVVLLVPGVRGGFTVDIPAN